MLKIRNQVAIVGCGYSRIGRHLDDPLGVLAVEAARAAAGDAGLDVREIDGLCVFPSPMMHGAGDFEGIDYVSVGYMARALQLPRLRWTCRVTPSSFVSSLAEAVNAVATGSCRYALIWRAMHNPSGRFGRYTQTVAKGSDEFTAPYGLSNYGMLYAIAYSRYMALHGATREHMAAFIVNNRRNATLNPHSVFKAKPITRDDYLNDRMFAEPLSYLDADMGVDGAGAVIITTAERARELKQKPAYVIGHASIGGETRNTPFRTLESFRDIAGFVADALWEGTGLRATDVDQPNLYDGFSWFTYGWLEALGFCKEGEAFEFIQGGRIALEGKLPLNTSGGSLGMGRMHGPPQVIESVLQLQGRAGNRQVPGTTITLAVTGSTFATVGAMLFTNDPTV